MPTEPVKPQKQRKPPSPHIPRLFAALAIISLLAIPVVVPVVVMKMTGKTGRRDRTLDQAIDEPELIGNLARVTANEETTQEEVQESFLKLNENKVSPRRSACWCSCTPHQPPVARCLALSSYVVHCAIIPSSQLFL